MAPGGGGWKALKEGLSAAVVPELHKALGLTYPRAEDEDMDDMNEEKSAWCEALSSLVALFEKNQVAVVFAQSKKRDDGTRARTPNNFEVKVKFGLLALQADLALSEVLDEAFRRTSGLPVRSGKAAVVVPGREGKRFLVYTSKPLSKGKGKGKGKGKAKGGKEGKGK